MGGPAAIGAAAPAGITPLHRPSVPGGVIVFQGDSITDAGRHRDYQGPNQARSLGHGYAALAAAHVLGAQPAAQWHCYNRGISGEKVPQLAARWEEDCLALEPDVISLLVGVNDFWHTLTHGYDGTAVSYEADYRALLDRTRDAMPDVALILGEPFAVAGGSALSDEWIAFEAYRAAAHRLADDYDAIWIPYQSVFDDALEAAPVDYWAPDGVHPTPAGHHRMAQAWLEAFRTATG